MSFNYFISQAVFRYIVDAVDMVATSGWRLLPRYRFDVDSGLWQHRDGRGDPPLSLTEIDYRSGAMRYTVEPRRDPDSILSAYLKAADEILASTTGDSDLTPPEVSIEFEHLRWFTLPHEIEITR